MLGEGFAVLRVMDKDKPELDNALAFSRDEFGVDILRS